VSRGGQKGRPRRVRVRVVRGLGEIAPKYVSEGGLEPCSWWYIPKRGIYHQPKLTQPRTCRAGISSAKGVGSTSRRRIPSV
jgi:hypothetical protein